METPSLQYVIDQHGNRIAVIVPIHEYDRMCEALGEPSAPEPTESDETGSTVEGEEGEAYTEEEEQILKKRLKALGYL